MTIRHHYAIGFRDVIVNEVRVIRPASSRKHVRGRR
jgi:hypothetical protein